MRTLWTWYKIAVLLSEACSSVVGPAVSQEVVTRDCNTPGKTLQKPERGRRETGLQVSFHLDRLLLGSYTWSYRVFLFNVYP